MDNKQYRKIAMNKHFCFIRHGAYEQLKNTPSALQPFALTKEGRVHAKDGSELVQDYLQQNRLKLHSHFHSSSLLRAWQTADIMQHALQSLSHQPISIETHDHLVERSVGGLANLTTSQIEKILQDDPRFPNPPENWKSNSHYCLPFPGAESLMQAGERVKTCVLKLAESLQEGELMLIFGHGAAFRHAAHLIGCLPFHKIDIYSMHHGRPVFFRQLKENEWAHDESLWKVRAKEKHND